MPVLPPDVGTDSASHISIHHPASSKINLRNPLPLSAAQEAQVKSLYYARVRARCSDEIRAFAECARGRTVTATWTCRQQRLAMNSCMIVHANQVEEDAARQEWFEGIQERRRKKVDEEEAVEKRRTEVIEMTKKQEEKEKKAEEEKLKAATTITNEAQQKKGWWR